MGEKRTDLLRGTLDLLVLKALSLEPLHGVSISRRITQMTLGAFQVSFGSLCTPSPQQCPNGSSSAASTRNIGKHAGYDLRKEKKKNHNDSRQTSMVIAILL